MADGFRRQIAAVHKLSLFSSVYTSISSSPSPSLKLETYNSLVVYYADFVFDRSSTNYYYLCIARAHWGKRPQKPHTTLLGNLKAAATFSFSLFIDSLKGTRKAFECFLSIGNSKVSQSESPRECDVTTIARTNESDFSDYCRKV